MSPPSGLLWSPASGGSKFALLPTLGNDLPTPMGAVFAARVLAVLLLGLAVSADQDLQSTTPPFGAEGIFWSPPIPSHLRLPPRRARVAPFTLHNQGLVQVAYSDPATGVYLGSPSIVRLDEDVLLVSHDHFPLWGRLKSTAVLSSKDGGASWQRRADRKSVV